MSANSDLEYRLLEKMSALARDLTSLQAPYVLVCLVVLGLLLAWQHALQRRISVSLFALSSPFGCINANSNLYSIAQEVSVERPYTYIQNKSSHPPCGHGNKS